MNIRETITESELDRLIKMQLAECSKEQKATFEKYRTPLQKAIIKSRDQIEQFFVVAKRGNEVMYYEDLVNGFNFSPFDKDGNLLQHWSDKDDLKNALSRWTDKPSENLFQQSHTRILLNKLIIPLLVSGVVMWLLLQWPPFLFVIIVGFVIVLIISPLLTSNHRGGNKLFRVMRKILKNVEVQKKET